MIDVCCVFQGSSDLATLVNQQQPTIKVLDRGWINGRIVLLDGQGNELPPRTEAVFIDVPVYGIQRNSRGDVFRPQLYWDETCKPPAAIDTDYA